MLARQLAHCGGQGHAGQQHDQAGEHHRLEIQRYQVRRSEGGDEGDQQGRDGLVTRRHPRPRRGVQAERADEPAAYRRHPEVGPAGLEQGGHAGRTQAEAQHRQPLRAPRHGAVQLAQQAVAAVDVQLAVDHAVGDLVHLAQATQVDLARGHADHLGDLRHGVAAAALFGEGQHDRGGCGQRVAVQGQARADLGDGLLQARGGRAVLVQAPRQGDDEGDAGMEGGGGGHRGSFALGDAGAPWRASGAHHAGFARARASDPPHGAGARPGGGAGGAALLGLRAESARCPQPI